MRSRQNGNHKILEIYLSDLKKEAQKEVLDLYQLKEDNYDIAPLFVLENETKKQRISK